MVKVGPLAVYSASPGDGSQGPFNRPITSTPQKLHGIDFEEGTAIIVRKSEAEIVGKGHAHFYDRRRAVYPDRPDFLALPGGMAFDLAERKVVRAARP